MIDLHSHILPGLDDGAGDLDDSLAMARSMVDDGVRIVAATPHVRDDYPTTAEAMSAALARVRAAVSEAGYEIDVRGGGEIALGRLERLDLETIQRFGLGGNPRLVLLEYPYSAEPRTLERECDRLRLAGVIPVIAHPERNPLIRERPTDLEGIVQSGALVQLTAASVDGRHGRAAAKCARRLLELELAHVIASDAHGAGVREAGLSLAADAVGGGELARWLTSLVPGALLRGDELPPRPSGLRRRSGIFGRIRR